MPEYNSKLEIHANRIIKYKTRSELNIYTKGKIILSRENDVRDITDIVKVIISM